MNYIIYQIKDIENVPYAFRGWNAAKTQFKFKDYERIYCGTENRYIKNEAILEALFEEFNLNHPSDFTGHSLSVSDIVILYDDKDYKYYYCGSVEWIDITKEIKEKDVK